MPLSVAAESWTVEMIRMIGHSAPGMSPSELQAAWRADAETLDTALADAETQLVELAVALVASEDAGCVQIGRRHLKHVLGAWPDTVRTLLGQAAQVSGPPGVKLLTALAQELGGFLDEVRKSQLVAACDNNPVGARVQLAATLKAPLSALQRSTGERVAQGA